MPIKGAFITLEGCEGSGKSTQLRLLKEYFEKTGTPCAFTREPGGESVAEKIREILLDARNKIKDETEALLFAAARVQHITNKILPEKAAGKTVVCDRYIDSSFAYQAFARGLSYDFVAGVNDYALKNCMPDLTLFYDITPEEAFIRKGGADAGDRMETSGLAFHKRVYEGYKKLVGLFGERIVVIDARGSAEEVFGLTLKVLKERKII